MPTDNGAYDTGKQERVREALETILRYAVAENDPLAYPDDVELVIAAVERKAES